MGRAIRLDHSVLAVSDWERSNRLVRDQLRVDDVAVEPQLNVHNSDLCAVWDGSIDEAVAHLERHGVEVETGPVERRSVYVRDPGGSLLEFISYA